MNKISEQDVKKVADLARINLNSDEIQSLGSDLSKILDYIDKLAELDVDQVAPTSHPLQIKNVYREDTIRDDFTQEQALSIAITSHQGSFKVPKVIE